LQLEEVLFPNSFLNEGLQHKVVCAWMGFLS